MSYGGESNAKRIARASAWMAMMDMLPQFDDPGYKLPGALRALVLAGPNAGDIRTLGALGVLPWHVTAVDIDPDAIRSSQEIEPDADYRVGDVLEVVTRRRKKRKPLKYDLIFLDYCSPISERAVRKSVRVAKAALINGGVFCTGFMYGRENGAAREGVKKARELSDAMADYAMEAPPEDFVTPAMKRMLDHKGLSPEVYSQLDRHGLTGKAKKAAEVGLKLISRVNLLQHMTVRVGIEHGIVLFNVGHVSYRSGRRTRTGRSSGVPMLYYMGKGYQLLGRPSRSKFMRQYDRLTQDFDENGMFYIERVEDDTDGEKVRALAVKIARRYSSHVAGDFLNLNPRTVAAWLAWETMREREEAKAV